MSRETVFDPLRRIEVALTPEERVRQWMIAQLRDVFGVPAHLMMSEAAFRCAQKPYRADILAFDRSGAPLLVVECKRPEVEINAEVARQALRYDAALSVRHIILTNGTTTYYFKREGGSFVPSAQIPSFEQMLCQR
ncbi:MAG: type I restriction enzyme HsdR N-terminal domain-containing protein [Bacteroidales bacterium]|nr:type I restriction enzyme HsdR N-terminal domain-containing protein [Candidatus Cryptobacteroides aphodequi]